MAIKIMDIYNIYFIDVKKMDSVFDIKEEACTQERLYRSEEHTSELQSQR